MSDTTWRERRAARPRFWLSETERIPERFDGLRGIGQRLVCLLAGHVPIRDHCGLADHDHCGWCQKPMPGKGR